MKNAVTIALMIAIGGLIVAFGLSSYRAMPDYAGVYLAHTSKTYVPLPCLKQWKKTPGYDDAELSTAGDARKRRYRIADGCQQFLMGVEQSIGSMLLRDQGILSSTKEWWDQPYRTEDGMVYPKPR